MLIDIPRIKFSFLVDSLGVIITALEDGTCPFGEQSLSHTLDTSFRAFAPGVEYDHFADSTSNKGLLINRELAK
jgi:hypothetical protein